jgi:hypothetical protein
LEEIMRALNAAALPSSFPQVGPRQKEAPGRPALPSSFQEALKSGWTIVKEESAVDIKDRQRKGVVLLRSKTLPSIRLRVPYTATAQSWKFAAPVAIDVN